MIQPGCCDICGIPLDAEYFDESGFVSKDEKNFPNIGERVVLASFEVQPQYCGVLQCFSQFVDTYARDNAEAPTPGFIWSIRRNGQPVAPYHNIQSVVNPWGYGSYGFQIRLDEHATVELSVYRQGRDNSCGDEIEVIGGRIMGRYWYNRLYGAEAPAAERAV